MHNDVYMCPELFQTCARNIPNIFENCQKSEEKRQHIRHMIRLAYIEGDSCVTKLSYVCIGLSKLYLCLIWVLPKLNDGFHKLFL